LKTRGIPNHIRSDNGPEFTAKAISEWLELLQLEVLYIQPGSPWENGFAESFNSRFRDEFLSLEEFDSLQAAKALTSHREEYNDHRPHSSLGYLPPSEFASQWPASAQSAHKTCYNIWGDSISARPAKFA
jgi:putative transposase